MPSKKLILGILLVIFINLLQAFLTPLAEDEAYYWVWSQHLDWGYFDHPPMVAWWISLGYSIFQNELGVRLLSAFMSGMTVLLSWKILQPKTKQEENLFGLILGSCVVFQAFGFLTTPDAPLLFFTVFYLYALKSFLEKNNWKSIFLLGIAFAGIMYSKYHGVLVIAFTLLPILHKLWRNPKFYLTILFSLILYKPHLNWLYEHDFSPISYHFSERSADEHFELIKLVNYFGMVFLGSAPFLVYYIWKAFFRFKSENPFEKSVKALTILPILFFLFTTFKDNVQPQWLLISFVSLAFICYWFWRNQPKNKTFYVLGLIGIGLILLLRILIAIPSISPLYKDKEFALTAGKLSSGKVVVEKYQEASLLLFYNPQREVAVHRTLGNRKSQYTLWDWEEDFYGQTIQYISPWVNSELSFKGLKNRDYFIKKIENYKTYHLIEIESEVTNLKFSEDTLVLGITITNGHDRPIEIGPNSDLKMNLNYYQDHQYNVLASTPISTETIQLKPFGQEKIQIKLPRIEQKGNFFANFGIQYQPIGTTYVSKVLQIENP